MLVENFKIKASAVSSKVFEFASLSLAFNYIRNYLTVNNYKNIAIPYLDKDESVLLRNTLQNAEIKIFDTALREHVNELQTGISKALFGIAETGTLVINSDREDIRLTSMLTDIHFVLLKSDQIVDKTTDLSEKMKNMFTSDFNYVAFITGPSRTADIERVLSIGVHGPLELHILILEN